MDQEDQAKKMREIIARAWADEGFKRRLLEDPAGTMKGEGMEIPDGVEIRAVENTDRLFHLVLPPIPAASELTDDDLARIAGGRDGCRYIYYGPGQYSM